MALTLFLCATALALLFAFKYFRQKEAIRVLADSLSSRTSILAHSQEFRGNNGSWMRLVNELNRLIEEISVLDRQSSGRLNQIETTLGNLQEGVLIIDRDNYILLANKALKKNFPEMERSEGMRVESAMHGSDFLSFVSEIKKTGSSGSREVSFSRGQQQRWMEVSAAKLTEAEQGNAPWYLFVLHDITQLKLLEKVRRQFVANASHELKTPVAVIKGYAETLLSDHESMSAEERHRFLKTVHRHSERLALLISDLLSLSSLESESPVLALKPVKAMRWLREIATDYSSNLRSRGLDLRLNLQGGGEATVNLDILKIRQVMDNLVENARKYGPQDGTIEIGASVADERLEIWVSDDGPGVPESDLARIFERFYRVDKGRSRETGGTGLGLSIVKRIVESHHGSVWAENLSKGGLRIRISLPLARVSRLAEVV